MLMFNRKARTISGLQAVLFRRNELLRELTAASQLALRQIKELQNRLADESSVNDILQAAFDAKRRELKVCLGENTKLQDSFQRLQYAYADALERVASLEDEVKDLQVLVDEYESHEGETWGIEIGGEG